MHLDMHLDVHLDPHSFAPTTERPYGVDATPPPPPPPSAPLLSPGSALGERQLHDVGDSH